ncbi:glycosyltransferase [Scytonema sp. UIC 10036]|uniref:glycosyltransferase family 2 protein n=1 Tax=Scytonema sp. UIC 10036 TaxID=2304196 RepID=UPI0012DAECEB|nr:glycosyltransferase family 2 protein [Scytonema sp. UIC 10036]MUG96109.1 glycosyltransferase [Scytonema sp. UIC 10036]
MRVAICINTCQRPGGLKRLLDGLNQLTFHHCETPDIEIIVVDNDSSGHACEFCAEISSEFKWVLKCYTEPRRGIPFARNKAITCAIAENVDFVAFIDDDEVPEPNWLDELLYVQSSYNADVVWGQILPYFPHSIPDWLAKGQFFHRPRYPTGYELKSAANNNTLIRAEVFKQQEKLLDERLALSGGSDWHFFMRLQRVGYKIVWADNALVHEWIPQSRTNLKWLLQRSYRIGITESFCEIDLKPSIAVKNQCIYKGIRRAIKGVLFIPLSFIMGQHQGIKTLLYIYHSLGMLAGVAGKQYEEYKEIHTL